MDFGPFSRSHISRLHKLLCFDCIYECWGSSEVKSLYQDRSVWRDQRRARRHWVDSGTATSGRTLTGTVSRRHRPFLTSTHADIQHRADSHDDSDDTACTTTSVNDGRDVHNVRTKGQQRRHVNTARPPVWLPTYLVSSSQRKGLPLQHAGKQQKRQRETSRQSKKHMAPTQPQPCRGSAR